jgi:hypothetical protein
MEFAGPNYAYLHPAELGAHNYVTRQLTLDARGAGMTQAAQHLLPHREVNHRDLVSGGLHGGCDAVKRAPGALVARLLSTQSNSASSES